MLTTVSLMRYMLLIPSQARNHSRTYYVINDCDIRKDVLVANVTAKEKVFFLSTAKRTNNTAEQSDKLRQLYIYENHYYKANFLIRDTHVDNFQVVRPGNLQIRKAIGITQRQSPFMGF